MTDLLSPAVPWPRDSSDDSSRKPGQPSDEFAPPATELVGSVSKATITSRIAGSATRYSEASPAEKNLHRWSAASWELDTSRARSLLDTLSHLICEEKVVDPAEREKWSERLLSDTIVADVNERAVSLTGSIANRSRMIGRSVDTLWPQDSRAVLAELIAAVATDRSGNATRMRRLASYGDLRNAVITAWRSEAYQRDAIFVAINGAAENNFSSWYLRASEEHYRKLIHQLPTPLLQVDASRLEALFGELKSRGIVHLDAYLDEHPQLIDFAKNTIFVTDANQKAVTLLHAPSADDLQRPVNFLFATSPETVRKLMFARFAGKRNFSEVIKIRTFDEQILDVRLSVTYPPPPERLDVTLVALEDITERLRTERQLRQLENDFTHAARISILGELATSIAHEVNQPLSTIVTDCDTAMRYLSRDEPNVAKVCQLTQRIASSAYQASEIVKRIREMAGKQATARVPLDLNEVVEDALLFVRHDIDARSISLSVRFDTGLPKVMGDRIQLQQVLVNLLVNGIQALAQGNSLTRRMDLSTAIEGDQVVFSVRDNGGGIASDDLDRIFDCFFTTKDDGVGIGLAVCQSIVAAHGGTIGAGNHPEGGAIFRFGLPTASADE